MKQIIEEPTTFKVELTLEEVEYIRAITQNYIGDPDEDYDESKIRLGLFVGASRLLGFNMNDNGEIIRG
jgi:hypothetical protein